MKKLFVVAMAVILGMSGTSAWAGQKVDKVDKCEFVAELAANIMSARQNGANLMQLRNALIEAAKGDDALIDMMASFLRLAYSQPVKGDAKSKEKAIKEFASLAAEACMETQ